MCYYEDRVKLKYLAKHPTSLCKAQTVGRAEQQVLNEGKERPKRTVRFIPGAFRARRMMLREFRSKHGTALDVGSGRDRVRSNHSRKLTRPASRMGGCLIWEGQVAFKPRIPS
jgi:hypothetical protein